MPSQLVMLTWNDGDVPMGPGNQLPSSPVYPSQGLPSGGNIDNSLPLPVYPYDPTVGIDNTLPTPTPPPTIWPPRPGMRFIVKYLACKGLILVPDNTLPATPEPK